MYLVISNNEVDETLHELLLRKSWDVFIANIVVVVASQHII
jgi:hypothetical protein